jgi:hypothetical protein
MRDIRVRAAFDALDVVNGTASGVFRRDASVFVSSRVCVLRARRGPDIFLTCARTHLFNGLQSTTRERKP